jgi:eukaryotic-like serine/threonine-protein kinase
VLAIDWKKPAIAWTFEPPQRAQPFYSSAAVTDSLVLIGGRDKSLHALDRKTGKEVWSFPTRGRVDSSPVVAGSRVYVGSLDGFLYVLDLANGTELQKIRLGGQVTASPVVVDGKLIIANQDGLVTCLGAK